MLAIVGQTYVNSVLLVHVVAATPRTALRHSSAFAIQLIQDFLRKYTKVNPEKVLDLSDRFRHLEVDSRLEIAFEGKPKKFVVPSYSVYNHQSEDGIVIFELETRVTARYMDRTVRIHVYGQLPLRPTFLFCHA